MKKKRVRFFVSYAHRNKQLANCLVQDLMEVMRPSRSHEYQLWSDSAILVGENWQKEIEEAIDQCSIGLLLVSPAFLGSKFICEEELPKLMGRSETIAVPVMLWPVDLELHDLKGLERLQIFRYRGKRYLDYRAYGECKSGAPRKEFVHELFRQIEGRLAAPNDF